MAKYFDKIITFVGLIPVLTGIILIWMKMESEDSLAGEERCPGGSFILPGMDSCRPLLDCTNIKKDIVIQGIIGQGAVKVVNEFLCIMRVHAYTYTHTHSHTHTHKRARTHWHSLSLALSHTHSHKDTNAHDPLPPPPPPPPCATHTHTCAQTGMHALALARACAHTHTPVTKF